MFRVPWWRERWRNELVPNAAIIVAEQADALIGFVTIDLKGYLDQLVVAPDHWGSKLADALVDEANRAGGRDNISVIAFKVVDSAEPGLDSGAGVFASGAAPARRASARSRHQTMNGIGA